MILRHNAMAAAMVLAAADLSLVNAQVVRVEGQVPVVPVPVAPAVPAVVPPVVPTPTVPVPTVPVPVQTPVRVDNLPAIRPADIGLWLTPRPNDGLIITDLTANGVFATAGLREGDLIVSINGQPVTTETHVVQYLTGPAIGTDPIPVVVMRGGRQQTIVVQASLIAKSIGAYDPLYQYGIVIDDRNPNQIVVRSVYPRTAAYYAGLRAGDVITTVGDQSITNIAILAQVLSRASAVVLVQVVRGGLPREIRLDPLLIVDGTARTALRPTIDSPTRTEAAIEFPTTVTARPTRIVDTVTPPLRAA